MPASRRISQTVDAATFTPSVSSSPCTRRYPQLLFFRASRSTRMRIERSVGGRPGRLGRETAAWRRATRSRCHWLEPDPLAAEVALQHDDLMAQREDLGVLVPIGARQQPPPRERVRDTEVRQSKEHEAASSRGHR